MVDESPVARVMDTADHQPEPAARGATAYRWYMLWFVCWAMLAVAWVADMHRALPVRNAIAGTCAHILIFALAVYVGAGVRRGRRLLGAVGLVGAYVFLGVIGSGMIVGGLSPRELPLPIWVGMVVFFVLSVSTLWILVRERLRAEHHMSA